MSLSPDMFDAVLNFVLKEGRYLKKRETSLREKELKDGEELFKKFIRAVQAKKMSDQELREMEGNDRKRAKLLREVAPKCKGLGKKQIDRMLQNYSRVYAIIEKKHKEHKIIIEALNGDKYYNPRKRTYK